MMKHEKSFRLCWLIKRTYGMTRGSRRNFKNVRFSPLLFFVVKTFNQNNFFFHFKWILMMWHKGMWLCCLREEGIWEPARDLIGILIALDYFWSSVTKAIDWGYGCDDFQPSQSFGLLKYIRFYYGEKGERMNYALDSCFLNGQLFGKRVWLLIRSELFCFIWF